MSSDKFGLSNEWELTHLISFREYVFRVSGSAYILEQSSSCMTLTRRSSITGEWRSRRVVRFKGRKDMFDLATGQQRLVGMEFGLSCMNLLLKPLLLDWAVQWRSWLSHTRVDPPTIEVHHIQQFGDPPFIL